MLELPDSVCTNPNCKEYGKRHYGCKCGSPMADGGVVGEFCASHGKHRPDCEYYAEGGEIETPDQVLGHHVAAKGLLGILKDAGKSTMQEPKKYDKVLHEAKTHHAMAQMDPQTPRPRTLGGRVGHHLINDDHESIADTMSGHPLVGLVGKGHLKEAMTHLSGPVVSQEPDAHAFRGSVDYLAHSYRGKDSLARSVRNLVDGKGKIIDHNPQSTEDLKKQVDRISANPDDMLNVGGNLGHYLPDHGAKLAATAAQAVSYLSSIKPLNTQASPLDAVLAPSKAAMSKYDRQVGLAQNPLMILQHAKDGTLQPEDIATVQTIYPALHKSIVDQVGQQIIDVTTQGIKVPYSTRASLSMLIGQPLDSTMTQSSMAAIIQSAAPKGNPPGRKPAPATTLKASDKANAMLETPLQARQIRKSK